MLQLSGEVSRHKCLIYDGHPSEQLPVIVPLLIDGLKEGRRCVYLGAPDMIEMMKGALEDKKVDTEKEVSRSALVFSSDRSHLKGGAFDPKAMVAGLTGLIDDALRDGFQGLWATGDMRWELGSDENFERLLEYEARLEQVFREKPLSGVCQYHRKTVPSGAIRDALMTHRSAFIGDDLNKDNLFYIPPELLLQHGGAELRDRQGEWMAAQIARIARAERERDRAQAALDRLNRDLERQVAERTSELREANVELEALGHSLSHDLRAPLRAIDGFTRSASERLAEKLDPDSKADLDRVTGAAGRMSALIEAMLELAQAGRCELMSTRVDLSRQAALIIEDLRSAHPDREVDVAIKPRMSARGDSRLIAAALSNLLGNAWKFTSKVPAPRIEFGSTGRGRKNVFFVKDNGEGFEMGRKGELFKEFSRLHSKADFPGSGIGLATCRRILLRHKGEIWAESAPGRGATFYFTLPD